MVRYLSLCGLLWFASAATVRFQKNKLGQYITEDISVGTPLQNVLFGFDFKNATPHFHRVPSPLFSSTFNIDDSDTIVGRTDVDFQDIFTFGGLPPVELLGIISTETTEFVAGAFFAFSPSSEFMSRHSLRVEFSQTSIADTLTFGAVEGRASGGIVPNFWRIEKFVEFRYLGAVSSVTLGVDLSVVGLVMSREMFKPFSDTNIFVLGGVSCRMERRIYDGFVGTSLTFTHVEFGVVSIPWALIRCIDENEIPGICSVEISVDETLEGVVVVVGDVFVRSVEHVNFHIGGYVSYQQRSAPISLSVLTTWRHLPRFKAPILKPDGRLVFYPINAKIPMDFFKQNSYPVGSQITLMAMPGDTSVWKIANEISRVFEFTKEFSGKCVSSMNIDEFFFSIRLSDGDDFYTCLVTIASGVDGYMRITTETNAKIAMIRHVHPPGEDLVHLENECSICRQEYVEGSEIVELKNCRHCFHSECIAEWARKGRDECPMCRETMRLNLNRWSNLARGVSNVCTIAARNGPLVLIMVLWLLEPVLPLLSDSLIDKVVLGVVYRFLHSWLPRPRILGVVLLYQLIIHYLKKEIFHTLLANQWKEYISLLLPKYEVLLKNIAKLPNRVSRLIKQHP